MARLQVAMWCVCARARMSVCVRPCVSKALLPKSFGRDVGPTGTSRRVARARVWCVCVGSGQGLCCEMQGLVFAACTARRRFPPLKRTNLLSV